MPRLLLDDLLDHTAVGHERALVVLLELPEPAAVEEELGHGQLHPALRKGHGLAGQALRDLRLDLLTREVAVHLGHRLVVLGLLLDVPDHELQPLLGDEAQPVAEHVGRGQLPVGLALHELDHHGAVLRGHLLFSMDLAGHSPTPHPIPRHVGGGNCSCQYCSALCCSIGPTLSLPT